MPLGGSVSVAQTVARRYRALGGTLHFGSKVEKILVEGGRAVGIRLASGTEHRADAVISAADGRTTTFGMLDGRFASPKIRRAYAEWKVYPPLVQVMQAWYTSNYDYWSTLHRDQRADAAEKQRVAELTICHAVQLLCRDDGKKFRSFAPSVGEGVASPEFHDDASPRLESSG